VLEITDLIRFFFSKGRKTFTLNTFPTYIVSKNKYYGANSMRNLKWIFNEPLKNKKNL
jgi:hypothetical protein